MALNDKATAVLLDWVPVASCLSKIRLQGPVDDRMDSFKHSLLVISAPVMTDCSTDAQMDEPYDELTAAVRKSKTLMS